MVHDLAGDPAGHLDLEGVLRAIDQLIRISILILKKHKILQSLESALTSVEKARGHRCPAPLGASGRSSRPLLRL